MSTSHFELVMHMVYYFHKSFKIKWSAGVTFPKMPNISPIERFATSVALESVRRTIQESKKRRKSVQDYKIKGRQKIATLEGSPRIISNFLHYALRNGKIFSL